MTMLATPPTLKSAAMSPPVSKRWTCREFQRLRGEGWFEGFRSMLIDGEILTMPTALPPHVVALGLVDDWLRLIFALGHHVRNQSGFDVGTDNDPEPDLAVVPGQRRDYISHQATTAVLMVEIADSSLAIDTKVKPHLYARAGVPEYWVLDVDRRELHVFRRPVADADAPRGHRYTEQFVLPHTAEIAPQAKPAAIIRIAELLP